jgi:hypothetical protein
LSLGEPELNQQGPVLIAPECLKSRATNPEYACASYTGRVLSGEVGYAVPPAAFPVKLLFLFAPPVNETSRV